MFSKLVCFSSIFLLFGCLNAPVHYKEKNFSISEKNIKNYCQKLEETFLDYNCQEYFSSTFEINENEEIITIELNRQNLNLTYKSESGKNEDLLETYELIIDAL